MRLGVCEDGFESDVRKRLAFEPRDPGWRPVDLATDSIEYNQGIDYRGSYPPDPTALYYWRPNFWRKRAT